MPNGALKEHLDAAWSELRSDVERARQNIERAMLALDLNGAKSRLPQGFVSALDECRKKCADANGSIERVMIEHLGIAKEKLHPVEDAVPEEAEA